MFNMTVVQPPLPTYNIWGARNAAGSLGHWCGNGRLYIDQGGLEIPSGGAYIGAGQMLVDSGVTITATGLVINAGGETVFGGGFGIGDGAAAIGSFALATDVFVGAIQTTGYTGTALEVKTRACNCHLLYFQPF